MLTFTRGEVEELFPGVPTSLLRDRIVFPQVGRKGWRWRRYDVDDLARAQCIERQIKAGASTEAIRRMARVVALGDGCTRALFGRPLQRRSRRASDAA